MRRSHKKSRRGCLECKRRHIKCDESRPHCINCTTAERKCSYPSTSDVTGHSPSDVSPSPGMSGASPSVTPAPAPAPAPAPDFGVVEVPPFPPMEEESHVVDMVHMELLYHYLTDTFASYTPMADLVKEVTMRIALQEPYLMHQVLALSACHLSILRPDHEAFYHNQAIQLQTRALTLFNSIDPDSFNHPPTNRVPVFLFSTLLGFHALCDMMSYRERDFPSTLARFVGYLRLDRGVYSVMEGHWEMLLESELRPIITIGQEWFDQAGTGPECKAIMKHIEAANLDVETLEATRRAINLLQWVFDVRPIPASRVHVLLAWTTMIQKPFVTMVEHGRPEALAILAHYFVAVHMCREVWMLGNAGLFLLRQTIEYLGPEWETWVEWPHQLVPRTRNPDAADGSRKPASTRTNKRQLQHPQSRAFQLPPMPRDFVISQPRTSEDAARIAEIHIVAMDSNPLLHAQFPTPDSLRGLQEFLTDYYQPSSNGESNKSAAASEGVLAARDPESGVIAGFAKWDCCRAAPSQQLGKASSAGGGRGVPATKLEAGELRDVEGCRREFLDGYALLAEEAKKRNFGGVERECYQLAFVCTDPAYQGQGAGKLLTRKVLDMAAAEGVPVYLESTMMAVSLYERLGFKAIDAFEMKIPGRASGSSEAGEVYREVCMVWSPDSD
ncbi:hypothetical protein B0T19DRAFT_459222 [Cercophora scortea]|uniref:Zn(2)-C6 fungal-type domain-containing protein n=1 Tax=Cercophora scortea TaxID=314031 RepID=A0AAE0IYV7_9PEZI|nr:hypothetical protein B0T19DRAFT_459222 [Cercophora scortea]